MKLDNCKEGTRVEVKTRRQPDGMFLKRNLGKRGTVQYIDDDSGVHVKFDNGELDWGRAHELRKVKHEVW